MTYQLRYFFDAGSGTCLWAGNDAAREEFDYAVEHWGLPLSENTKRKISHLIAWYDTGLNWDSPSDPSPWSKDESDRFDAEATNLLATLSKELGDDYEVTDER